MTWTETMIEETEKERPAQSTKDSREQSVRAVERALDVLFTFSEGEAIQDIGSLQRHTGLSRPTLYRLLHTLEGKGVIFSSGNPRQFQLGYRFGTLLRTWNQSPVIASIAREPLEQLWQETQETVALMVPVSLTHRMCVLELKSPQAISFSRGTGYTEVLTRGASGKVILAYMPPERREKALATLDAKQRERLLQELGQIREQRIWLTYGDVIPGGAALASPVLTKDQEAVASVCVFGTELRMRDQTLDRCIQAVRQAAADIEHRLFDTAR